MSVNVTMYVFGVHSRNINRFLSYVESGHVYPTRQSYMMFIAKDEQGQVYKSVVIKGQESKVKSMIYQYQDKSINIQDIRQQANDNITTVVSNKHHEDYTCTMLTTNSLYMQSSCSIQEVIEVPDKPEIPEGQKVPTSSEWSLILTCLLVAMTFYTKVLKRGV